MAEVTIHEVGPRDGLQNETAVIPTADKIALIDLAVRDGSETDRGDQLRLAQMGAATG